MRGNPKAQPPVGVRFEKGKSGNPGGRPKGRADVEALAREHSSKAIKTLADICGSVDAPPAARVSAASVLLDRGWGRPTARAEIGKPGDFTALTDDELMAIASGSGEGAADAPGRTGEPGTVH